MNNGGCAQLCTNTPGSYQCNCNNGYTLNLDGHNCSGNMKYGNFIIIMLLNIFSDINECSNDNGHCEHVCINTNGNYSCSCQDGYSLDINEKNCTGNCFE